MQFPTIRREAARTGLNPNAAGWHMGCTFRLRSTTVSQTHIDLQFSDTLGRAHHLEVLTINGRGWHLHAALADRNFDKHCGSWQGVERTLNWLRRHAHETATVPTRAITHPVVRAAAVAAMVFAAATGYAQSLPLVDPPTLTFMAATREYAVAHRRVEQEIGPIQITDRPETIRQAIEAMAAAMRAERPEARQGDLFTPALAAALRVRIDQVLRVHGFTAADVLAEGTEGPDPSMFTLRVNGSFPWVLSHAMFPCLTGALPPLPPELQYRMVGADLMLIDVHASLIVDILPNAMPDLTLRDDRPEEWRGLFRGAVEIPRRPASQ